MCRRVREKKNPRRANSGDLSRRHTMNVKCLRRWESLGSVVAEHRKWSSAGGQISVFSSSEESAQARVIKEMCNERDVMQADAMINCQQQCRTLLLLLWNAFDAAMSAMRREETQSRRRDHESCCCCRSMLTGVSHRSFLLLLQRMMLVVMMSMSAVSMTMMMPICLHLLCDVSVLPLLNGEIKCTLGRRSAAAPDLQQPGHTHSLLIAGQRENRQRRTKQRERGLIERGSSILAR